MIAGTMVFEDQVLQWQLFDGAVVQYTVSEGRHGKTATKTVSWQEFAAALALAVGSDEMPGANELYPLAEKAMPEGFDLRWIP